MIVQLTLINHNRYAGRGILHLFLNSINMKFTFKLVVKSTVIVQCLLTDLALLHKVKS